MTATAENFDDFESTVLAQDDPLVVTVDGFEGPLDLLLTLARNQKVDIAKISILKLADQYLEFIESAKRMNLELAADYLVMAAWLAYLKQHASVLLIEEARARLERMLGKISDWSGLDRLLPFEWSGGLRRRSAL